MWKIFIHSSTLHKYFKDEFAQNRAEYRNRGNDITDLQTSRIYCHINGLKARGS